MSDGDIFGLIYFVLCPLIAFLLVWVFFQILMYKLGCKQGEKTAYKRFTKVCNVCRNKK